MAYTPDLDQMLHAGARYVDEQTHYVIERHLIGEVNLPTGQIVGCDPLAYSGDALPFTVPVSPGRYPLGAWVAVLYSGDREWERRVAALQLIIRDEPTTRWQLALVKGQDLAALGEDEYFGYAVDAGTGTLADLAAVQAMASTRRSLAIPPKATSARSSPTSRSIPRDGSHSADVSSVHPRRRSPHGSKCRCSRPRPSRPRPGRRCGIRCPRSTHLARSVKLLRRESHLVTRGRNGWRCVMSRCGSSRATW